MSHPLGQGVRRFAYGIEDAKVYRCQTRKDSIDLVYRFWPDARALCHVPRHAIGHMAYAFDIRYWEDAEGRILAKTVSFYRSTNIYSGVTPRTNLRTDGVAVRITEANKHLLLKPAKDRKRRKLLSQRPGFIAREVARSMTEDQAKLGAAVADGLVEYRGRRVAVIWQQPYHPDKTRVIVAPLIPSATPIEVRRDQLVILNPEVES